MTHAIKGLASRGTVEEMILEPGEIHVTVVSPAGPVFQGVASYLVVEGLMGQLAVAPKHAAMVAALGIGPLRVHHSKENADRYAIRGGILTVAKNLTTVLVDEIIAPDAVDAEAAKKGLDEALEGMRNPKSAEEFDDLLKQRAWYQAQLALVR
ncbi:MAG: ATP synthase F1 subunit epsilon [Planctomycetota bacterium]